MLKDITIGQHFPGHSILHRCDPRLKLVATIAYIVVLFVAPNPLGLALSILLLAALYKVAQIPGKMILKSLKPIVPIVIFTAVLNLFFVTGQGAHRPHRRAVQTVSHAARANRPFRCWRDGSRAPTPRRQWHRGLARRQHG